MASDRDGMGIMPGRFTTTSAPDVVVTGVTLGSSGTVSHQCYGNPCQVCGRSFTVDPPAPIVGGSVKPTRCQCFYCGTSRGVAALRKALEEVDGSTNAMVDHSGEMEMAFAWLRDEVEAVAAQRRGWLVRRRLHKALEVAAWPTFHTGLGGQSS